ncbi:hypothetical protein U6N48_12240 [Cutibacterium acnes]
MNEALAGIYGTFNGMSGWQALGLTALAGLIVLIILLDTDWKRCLFETYSEKLKRSEAFRNKEYAKYQKRQDEIKKLLNR